MRIPLVLIAVIALSACGPAANDAIEYKYFLGFRSADFLRYDNTYQFSDEKPAGRTPAEYFRVHIDKGTRRFFKIEHVKGKETVATYLFDNACRLTEQLENGRTIVWKYGPDVKTAEVIRNNRPVGRNVFEYRGGSLARISFYDASGALVTAVPVEPGPEPETGDLDFRMRINAEPAEADKALRREALDLLELGN